MRKRDPKALLLRMGKARRGQRDERDLPNFDAPQISRHSRLAGRGVGKAKRGKR